MDFLNNVMKGISVSNKGGGLKRSNKSKKIEILNSKYTVDQLRKYAISKKIKIFKKINGTKVLLPKATLLEKIYNFKFAK